MGRGATISERPKTGSRFADRTPRRSRVPGKTGRRREKIRNTPTHRVNATRKVSAGTRETTRKSFPLNRKSYRRACIYITIVITSLLYTNGLRRIFYFSPLDSRTFFGPTNPTSYARGGSSRYRPRLCPRSVNFRSSIHTPPHEPVRVRRLRRRRCAY